jgi:hypothetical protein
MTRPENRPNDIIGIIGLMHVAKNETAVVMEVISIEFADFLNV